MRATILQEQNKKNSSSEPFCKNIKIVPNTIRQDTREAVRAGEKLFNKMTHKSNFSIEATVANCSGAMEADTISKNGRSSKSQMSKGNC